MKVTAASMLFSFNFFLISNVFLPHCKTRAFYIKVDGYLSIMIFLTVIKTKSDQKLDRDTWTPISIEVKYTLLTALWWVKLTIPCGFKMMCIMMKASNVILSYPSCHLLEKMWTTTVNSKEQLGVLVGIRADKTMVNRGLNNPKVIVARLFV